VIGPQRFARGCDIGNRLGRFVFHGAFGGALAIDDLIIRNTRLFQEFTHQAVVFRGDPQTEPVTRTKCGGGGIQIVQCIHINPAVRHSQNQIGKTEPQFCHHLNPLIPCGQFFADQVNPRDAQMNAARGQFAGNFTCRQQNQFHARHTIHGACIFAI